MTRNLNTPIRIQNTDIENRLWLAPMVGLSHVALRELIRHYGFCGLFFTEMCSAKRLESENPLFSSVFRWQEHELSRLVCQIAGDDPKHMILAAKRIEREGFFAVDINMGCSVSHIVKQGAGAALLKNPENALRVAKAVRDAVNIPVFIKFRVGWESNLDTALYLAQEFEKIGIDCLTFHPRIAPDRRTRPAKWEYVTELQSKTNLPIAGNGDIFSPTAAKDFFEKSQCAAISLGRIAVARPWIFSQIINDFSPEKNIYHDCPLLMLALLEKYYDAPTAIKLYKKFMLYFSANFRYNTFLRPKLVAGDSLDAFRENLRAFNLPEQEIAPNPSLNILC